MNAFDFDFIVLPLALLVFGMVAGVILLSKKQEIRQKRKARRASAYLKGKAKQRELLDNQIGNLDQLFQKKSIDKDTYERLKTLVRMTEEKTEETVEVLAEVISEK
jgi:hypothetical protein